MPRKKALSKVERAFGLIKGLNSWELKCLLERLAEVGLEIPPVLVAAVQQQTNGGAGQLPLEEKQVLCNVAITSYGDFYDKIKVIKVVRLLYRTPLGLKEAKDLVETVHPSYSGGTPALILEGVSWEEAEEAERKLEEAGATVELTYV